MKNKEMRWKEFIIKKGVNKAKRLAHTEELPNKDTVTLSKGAILTEILNIMPTIRTALDNVTNLDIFNELETSEAFNEWSSLVDRNNELMDVAFNVAKSMFSKEVLEDYRARFEIKDVVNELNCK